MNDKKFDAVMMREIRDRLSMKYTEDPDTEEKDLEEIGRKYGMNKTTILQKSMP